eukprot:CAMPEP_0194763058 /NCGR_PEP_ID=MMETSP0323_2-20130528/17840_1 /TAXON_ID=2866 ORGANISM="Crypthecodinium cohnii, Strain Seligo" /NCGR_SAMPLE_ID=MMETSP0323_2 /ASSEMBLY_ACC=CAM_ASM_000346 /LENGTH=36 /DNA_ID= /DNA_START= /DNA_END= /DNA_ORIENTATION=
MTLARSGVARPIPWCTPKESSETDGSPIERLHTKAL